MDIEEDVGYEKGSENDRAFQKLVYENVCFFVFFYERCFMFGKIN